MEFLKIEEVAGKLGVTRIGVDQLIQRGGLAAVRMALRFSVARHEQRKVRLQTRHKALIRDKSFT